MEPLTIPNPQACGMGQGANCCAFLTLGGAGFLCGRTMDGVREHIQMRLQQGTINAQFDPGDVPYPECQPFPEAT